MGIHLQFQRHVKIPGTKSRDARRKIRISTAMLCLKYKIMKKMALQI